MSARPRSSVPLLLLALALPACGDLGTEPPAPSTTLLPPRPATEYRVVGLGTLGGDYGSAYGINDRDVVVGMSETSDGVLRAFRWSDGTMEELEGLGGSSSAAYAINASGLIVGEAETADGHLRAVAWTSEGIVELGTLGGSTSQALAVNERGQIAGVAQNASGAHRAFLWSNGSMQELPLPSGTWTWASAEGINARGDVVGTVKETGSRAVLWADGRVTMLESECGQSRANDINGRGRIVGRGLGCPPPSSPVIGVPLVWSGDGPAEILEPVGGWIEPLTSPQYQNSGDARAVNERGWAVGTSSLEPDAYWMIRATLWQNDEPVSMGGDPGHGSPWRRAIAEDVNERGVAAGVSGTTPALYAPSRVAAVATDTIPGQLAPSAMEVDAEAVSGAAGLALFGSRAGEEWAVERCRSGGPSGGSPTLADILAGCAGSSR